MLEGKEAQERFIAFWNTMSDQDIRKEEEMEEKEVSTSEGGN